MENKKTSTLGAIAPAVVGGLSTIAGWTGIGEGRQDRRQIKQQGALNEVNAKTAKEMADYEQGLKLKMWNDTNYKAQLEQADKAGVSKAAVLGGSGTGTQGASVGSVGGGSAADAASAQNAKTQMMGAGMQLASQLALMKAQKENIEADTANKIAGEGLTREDIEKRKLDTLTQGETFTKTAAESQEATRGLEDRLIKLKAEAVGSKIENRAKEMGIKVDGEKIKQMAAQVAQGWKGLDQGDQKLKIEKFKADVEANYPGITKVLGRIGDDTIETLFNLTNTDRPTHKGVKN